MKLWYRFSAVLNDIKEGISDIIEVMRLREVMDDLIKDYWTTAKKQIKYLHKHYENSNLQIPKSN
ncbi:MAG: hypothetical protein LBR43_03670 [Spiroplasmataceae bacterium]|nr:hypothetical protein [Spiroplasmataceae bacterium]